MRLPGSGCAPSGFRVLHRTRPAGMIARMNTNVSNGPLIVGLGEVLWDLLPTGRVLGGAPGNVAFHAAGLGGRGAVASATEIRQSLRDAGLDISALAVDPTRPTGTVTVELDEAGVPSFIIHQDVAWDAIPYSDSLEELISRADAVCFGSLAQRSDVSRRTIRQAMTSVPEHCLRICDVNLRQHYYSRDVLVESFTEADVLKCNEDELPVIAELLGLPADPEHAMGAILVRFGLKLVILTCGSDGSVLMTPDEVSRETGEPVAVVDSVGAGDAFTATVAIGMLLGRPLSEIHSRAERVARYVCTQPGATPALPEDLRYPTKE
jgi:fructokinase